jgi:hypothetical protein
MPRTNGAVLMRSRSFVSQEDKSYRVWPLIKHFLSAIFRLVALMRLAPGSSASALSRIDGVNRPEVEVKVLAATVASLSLIASISSRAAAEPRPRPGSLHRLPRLGAGARQPDAGPDRERAGLDSVFLASTLVVLCAAPIAMRLLYAPSLAKRTCAPLAT